MLSVTAGPDGRSPSLWPPKAPWFISIVSRLLGRLARPGVHTDLSMNDARSGFRGCVWALTVVQAIRSAAGSFWRQVYGAR